LLLGAAVDEEAGGPDLEEVTAWARFPEGPAHGTTYRIDPEGPLSAAGGMLTFNTAAVDDWTMAVVYLPAELTDGLEEGRRYLFTVEASGAPGGSTIVSVPEPDWSKSTEETKVALGVWQNTGSGWNTLRAEFVYDPEVNDGALQFFYGPNQQGHEYQYRDFKVEAVD
jgi:hypothetical protein